MQKREAGKFLSVVGWNLWDCAGVEKDKSNSGYQINRFSHRLFVSKKLFVRFTRFSAALLKGWIKMHHERHSNSLVGDMNYVFLTSKDNAVDCWTLTSRRPSRVVQTELASCWTMWMTGGFTNRALERQGWMEGLEGRRTLGLAWCTDNLQAASWTVGHHSLNQPNEKVYLPSLALEQWPFHRFFHWDILVDTEQSSALMCSWKTKEEPCPKHYKYF